MIQKNLLIMIRYLSLFCLVISLLISNANLPFYFIILLLLLIINNQFRYFSLTRERYILVSIVLEVILMSVVQLFFNGFIGFYFIPSMLDSILLLSKKLGYVSMSLIYFISLCLLGIYFDMNQLSIYLCFMMMTGLCFYIKYEQDGKFDAQLLYDQLRISQNELKHANEELELYASSISELAVLKERNRISREIHDSVGHALSTAMIQLGAMEAIATKEQSPLSDMAKNLREFIKLSYHDVRKAVTELKPAEYADYQDLYRMTELIENFKKLSGISVRLTISKDKWTLSSKQGLVMYRIVQESLSNASRHGKATQVNIFLTFKDDGLIINIKDNGLGCSNVVKGVGLTSMMERVAEIGGNVSYNSSTHEGFSLSVSIPKRSGSDYGGTY